MKAYERKLKIEILTFMVTISYFFMIRDDNTILESSVLLGLFTVWTLFALGYHIWDFKSRGLSFKTWSSAFKKKCKSGQSDISRVYKYFKVIAIVFSVLVLLLAITILVIGIFEKARVVDLSIVVISIIIGLIASLECLAFLIACFARINQKYKNLD